MITSILRPGAEPMSSSDTAWLRMDSPTNLMMISGVVVFNDRVGLAALRDLIESRFASLERFRMRAVRDLTGSYWEADTQFAIENHVVALDVKDDLDERGLEELASRMASSPLNRDRPLWQFQLIERFGAGSALISRIHHCYADGIALIQVLLSMTDTQPRPKRRAGAPPERRQKTRGLLDQMFNDARALGEKGGRAGRELLRDGIRISRDRDEVMDLAKKGTVLAGDILRFVFKPPDARSRYRGRLGPTKRVAWTDPLPLDEVKAVGKVHGCTVNDVLLSAVAGAMRGWLCDQGDKVDGLEINAAVPVNLRPSIRPGELGNRFGLVFLGIPIGIADPVERLHAVNRKMAELKESYQPQISLGLLSLVGRGPSAMQRPVLEMFSSKATTVMTNVPGPQQPLYMAGAEIDKLLFWVPQSGSIGVGVSILSYNGKVHFGLMADSNLVADPGHIIRRVRGEFEKLVLATLMEAWDAPAPRPEELNGEHNEQAQ